MIHLPPEWLSCFAHRIVIQPGGCWTFIGARHSGGYGNVRLNKKYWVSHRLSYFLASGKDPVGLTVRHKCDVRLCVNPAHLIGGTARDNTQDMIAKGRAGWITQSPTKRLTESDVLAIRQCAGTQTRSEIGRRFGVNSRTVYEIVHRKSWKHLPDPVEAAS